MKILFVCTLNKMRSLTAEEVFKSDERFEVKSAGTASNATKIIDLEILNWADIIFVMEKHHRNAIRNRFPEIYKTKRIICMYIPDDFKFMDQNLINLLKAKFKFLWAKEIEPGLES